MVVTAPLERPKTPASVVLIGSVVAVVVGLIILKIAIGFVITLAKVAIGVVVITALVIALGRAFGDD